VVCIMWGTEGRTILIVWGVEGEGEGSGVTINYGPRGENLLAGPHSSPPPDA